MVGVGSYEKNGKKQYTLSAKIEYHKKIADTGKKDGKPVSKSEAIRHGVLAKKNTDKLQGFMAYDKSDRNRIVNGQKPEGKQDFSKKN